MRCHVVLPTSFGCSLDLHRISLDEQVACLFDEIVEILDFGSGFDGTASYRMGAYTSRHVTCHGNVITSCAVERSMRDVQNLSIRVRLHSCIHFSENSITLS